MADEVPTAQFTESAAAAKLLPNETNFANETQKEMSVPVPLYMQSCDDSEIAANEPLLFLAANETQKEMAQTNEHLPPEAETPRTKHKNKSFIISVNDAAGVMEMSHKSFATAKSNELCSTPSLSSLSSSPSRATFNGNPLDGPLAPAKDNDNDKEKDKDKDNPLFVSKARRDSEFSVVKETLEDERKCLEAVAESLQSVHALEMYRREVDADLSSDSSSSSSSLSSSAEKTKHKRKNSKQHRRSEDDAWARYSYVDDDSDDLAALPKHPIESLFRVCPPRARKHNHNHNNEEEKDNNHNSSGENGQSGLRMKYKKITEAVVTSAWGKPPRAAFFSPRARRPLIGFLPAVLSRPASTLSLGIKDKDKDKDKEREGERECESVKESPPKRNSAVFCTAVASRRISGETKKLSPENSEKTNAEENGEPHRAEALANFANAADEKEKEKENEKEKEKEKRFYTPLLVAETSAKHSSASPPLALSGDKLFLSDSDEKKNDLTLPPLGRKHNSSLSAAGDRSRKSSSALHLSFARSSESRPFAAAAPTGESENVKRKSFSSDVQSQNDLIFNRAEKGLMRERESLQMVEGILNDLRAAGIGKSQEREESEEREGEEREEGKEELKEELRRLLKDQKQNEKRIRELQAILKE